MYEVERITDLDRPELRPYRTMRWDATHRALNLFVAEGEKVVRRLLESDLEIVSMLMPPKWLEVLSGQLAARPERIRVFVAEKSLLETLTGFTMYQGLLAVARIPPPRPLEELVAGLARPQLWVAMEGLSNAENVGVLVRNSAAFGVQGLVVGETCSSPWLRRAVRTSMGTVFRIPVVEAVRLTHTLRELQSYGIRCVAAHPRPEATPLSKADLRGDCCLVFGSEGSGLTEATVSVCDEMVAIPMAPGVDSLNVGSASAVFLYEVNRQRGRV
ncbi:RNA methyltransferase [Limisphaera ngatamarikiensis]|jgi:tRNA G18 (ribose-2'-O)-methylase SpoU|uniref:RNA methyltransferase n=1 Tax=Limisphaera ngatamarikiensis TaxID=1324935 RepID=A0A6M1RP21_9BACT|nr:RNA methyltransferase [Limisphaera ngatamarikiensis]NGO38435.1 RNA methyltransferase [Limisphaera ngatamarikiensis]